MSSGSSNSTNAAKAALRVLTYNIHCGIGMDEVHDNSRIIEVIRRLHPDFASLNEVDIETERAKFTNIGTEIRQNLGFGAYYAPTLPRPNPDCGPGNYGIMGIGPGLFEVMAQLRLPTPEPYEPRTVLMLRSCGERQVYYIVTHLPCEEDDKTAQLRVKCLKFITDYVVQNNFYPAILLGDMNALPATAEINYLRENWTVCNDINPQCSWPSDHPTMQIDYIAFCPKDSFKVKHCEVIDERMASDHRPVVADLEFAH